LLFSNRTFLPILGQRYAGRYKARSQHHEGRGTRVEPWGGNWHGY
jgi:hypothetical protein